MPLFATGISHHTAPLEVRERLAFPADRFGDMLAGLKAETGAKEAVLVSTCNRTELYVVCDADDPAPLLDWLASTGGLQSDRQDDWFYVHQGEQAVQHLYRVACGLDSLVLGEPQIIGQLKQALNAAVQNGSAGKITTRLFQRAFAASKTVRHATGINDHPVSVAYITAILAQQIFGDLADQTVLMIGAGEMVDLCGRHLAQQGVKRLLIANRSLDRAEALAETYGAEAFTLDAIEERLHEADIVISSTASRTHIISAEAAQRASRQRRHRPVFMVDLGVPRDIDPGISRLRDIYLYTIDDLQQVADDNLEQRQRAAEAAGETLDGSVGDYLRWLHGNRAALNIERLRGESEAAAERLAQRALNRMANGTDAGEAVRQLANTLVHKMLHGPSVRLREAAEDDRLDLLTAADWLFEPDDKDGDDAS